MSSLFYEVRAKMSGTSTWSELQKEPQYILQKIKRCKRTENGKTYRDGCHMINSE